MLPVKTNESCENVDENMYENNTHPKCSTRALTLGIEENCFAEGTSDENNTKSTLRKNQKI